MKRIILSCSLLIAAVLFSLSMQAATYYMTPEGAGNKSGSDWDNAKASPTSAINVVSGDTYYLKVGIYELSNFTAMSSGQRTGHFFQITVAASNITIEGGFTGNGMEKSTTETTILNGDNSTNGDHRFLQVSNSTLSNVTVKGIVFQNRTGSTSQGGGVLTRPGISFEDCVFKNNATSDNNTSRASGGAVCISESQNGTVNFTRCQFISNQAIGGNNSSAAAIGVGAGATGTLTVNINNCFFNGNSAYSGGAISVKTTNHTVNISNCTFVDNTSNTSGDGGAVYVQGGTTVISNSIFFNNRKGTVDNNIYGTVSKSGTLDILPPVGVTIDLSAYPDGIPTDGQVSIPYSINVNYSTPVTATVNGMPSTAAAPYIYTVNDNTTLALSATPQIPVTVTESNHSNATISGLTPSGTASSTTYPISGTVTADANYHLPYVSINGAYVPVASNGSFTYTADLTSTTAFTVNAVAYAENVLPVREDTYVNGSTTSENNYTKTQILVGIGSSNASYTRRTYLRFDIPASISQSNYNQAELRLVSVTASNKTGYSRLLVKTVPETLPAISAMTWVANSEQYTTTFGNAVSPINAYATGQPATGTAITFDCGDVLQYAANNSLSLQVATLPYGTTHATNEAVSNDATIYFHSLENGNADYVPQLVFSYEPTTSLPAVIADNAPVRYYNLRGIEVSSPEKGNIYIVRQGEKVTKIVY